MKCENRSRTTCSRFHRLHSESNLACRGGLRGSTRSSRAAHTISKSKRRIRWHCSCRITLITSTLFSGSCGHVHPCCRSCLRKRTTTSPKKHRSKAAEQQRGVQKIIDHFHNLPLDLRLRNSDNLSGAPGAPVHSYADIRIHENVCRMCVWRG